MPRTRLTGFSRLLLFLLIALPIVYFGASYYNGEDPVAQVKDWIGVEEETPSPREESLPRAGEESGTRDQPATFENVQELRAENDRLREDLARCRNTTGI